MVSDALLKIADELTNEAIEYEFCDGCILIKDSECVIEDSGTPWKPEIWVNEVRISIPTNTLKSIKQAIQEENEERYGITE